MHTHPATHTDGEYEMPSVEALLAGTLALMTGHAQSACTRQRGLMAQKIGTNLCCLAQHPALSANFKAVVERMRAHWAVFAPSIADAPYPWPASTTRLQ